MGATTQSMITEFTDAYSPNVVRFSSTQEREEIVALEAKGFLFDARPMVGGIRVDFEHIDRYSELESSNSSEQSVILRDCREKFTFKMAQNQCLAQSTKFTMVSLHSGGLVDTLSAIRAGWTPIWGAEICPTHTQLPNQCDKIKRHSKCEDNLQQRLWNILTGTISYGNA